SADGTIYYTMKLISGRTLREILRDIRDGNEDTIEDYPLDKLLTIFQKVCDGMAYSHSLNVVHRDLKPDNIMVGAFGEVLILDWGLAKVLSAEGDAHEANTDGEEFDGALPEGADGFATMAGQVKGTPNYMAPEQAEGRIQDIDNRTDTYALGGILYCILTLHPPVTGANLDEILTRVTSSQIVPPLDYNKAEVQNPTGLPAPHCPEGRIPSALSAVAMKCMSYESEDRYMFVEALQGELQLFQSGYATGAEDAGFFTQMKLLLSRNKKEVFFILMIILGMVASAAVFIGQTQLAKDEAERQAQVAEDRINELKKTAPTFLSVAEELLADAKFNDALTYLEEAINLDDRDPRFYKTRGDIYQAKLEMGKAFDAYEDARIKHRDLTDSGLTISNFRGEVLAKWEEQLKSSAALANSLRSKGALTNDVESLERLGNLMRDQNRIPEAMSIARALASIDSGQEVEFNRKLFMRAGFTEGLTKEGNGKLTLQTDGLANVKLKDGVIKLSTIAQAAGLPLRSLDISDCKELSDISALNLMPLEELNLSGTDVDDLSIIKTLKQLRKLDLSNCEMLTDLSELQGLTNITELNLSGSKRIDSLSPLRGIPLVRLDISDTELRDIGALTVDNLEWLSIENTKVININVLSNAPLDYFVAAGTRIRHIKPFTNENARLRQRLDLTATFVKDLSPLKGKQMPYLDLTKCRMSDLSPLEGMPLRYLNLREVLVTDLKPLKDMPFETLILADSRITDIKALEHQLNIKSLDLSGTKITSLKPLKGAPLNKLNLARTAIGVNELDHLRNMPLKILRLDYVVNKSVELNPLWDCQDLEYLAVPSPGQNVEALRKLPNIKKMTYSVPDGKWDSAPSQEDFWKAYDATGRRQQ
ncbi:MAG: protein kinase domain-containing protein, partial [Limisphaerales bacterium]